MADSTNSALRVALVAEEGKQRDQLNDLITEQGLQVIQQSSLSKLAADGLRDMDADVILIDLQEEPDVLGLENLIEAAPAPILFSESAQAQGRSWGLKLVHKLTALAQRAHDQVPSPVQCEPPATAKNAPDLKVVGEQLEPAAAAEWVCVLGASIGGPEALKQFLSTLPERPPVGLLLAQHMGGGVEQRLVSLLGRAASLPVRIARTGDVIRQGELLVVPTAGRLELDEQGALVCTHTAWSGAYSPAIDDVMSTVAQRYGARSIGVLLSGMGDDGAAGAQAIVNAGGEVWAQDEASCVLSSIPDAARRRGVVSFSAAPKELAQRLVEICQQAAQEG